VEFVNFSQTLEKLMGVLIKDSKRPAVIGGPFAIPNQFARELFKRLAKIHKFNL